jgi:hypothetical protein
MSLIGASMLGCVTKRSLVDVVGCWFSRSLSNFQSMCLEVPGGYPVLALTGSSRLRLRSLH